MERLHMNHSAIVTLEILGFSSIMNVEKDLFGCFFLKSGRRQEGDTFSTGNNRSYSAADE